MIYLLAVKDSDGNYHAIDMFYTLHDVMVHVSKCNNQPPYYMCYVIFSIDKNNMLQIKFDDGKILID